MIGLAKSIVLKLKNDILGIRTPDYIAPADMQRLYIPNNIAPIDEFPQL